MLPFASSFRIFINVFTFLYVKVNSKEIGEEILFPSFFRKNAAVSIFEIILISHTPPQLLLERFSIAFTANGKRQAEISRVPKTREIYLVSAYALPVSHSYGASTKNREIR